MWGGGCRCWVVGVGMGWWVQIWGGIKVATVMGKEITTSKWKL